MTINLNQRIKLKAVRRSSVKSWQSTVPISMNLPHRPRGAVAAKIVFEVETSGFTCGYASPVATLVVVTTPRTNTPPLTSARLLIRSSRLWSQMKVGAGATLMKCCFRASPKLLKKKVT